MMRAYLSLIRRLVIAGVVSSLMGATVGHADESRVKALKVPEGFEVTTAVTPGLTAYPMFITFDDRGRMYVAESTGKDLSGKEMAAAPECRILRLVDTEGDGIFDSRTIFATELSLPMGVLWHQGALFVASPPDLLRFDDASGDGVADQRTVLLTGWNVLNTASLHGPFPGPDGLLYLTHGRHGYKIATHEGPVLEGMAARIWRCRPDGTRLQRFAGGGFDNPVELIFTKTGQMLGTMTYFTDPHHGQRDALMHWVWGGVYPKPHEVTAELLQTGPLMPVMTKFARIAPAGFLQYEGDGFGAAYRGALFSAQFNPHRIQVHRTAESGSTYTTEDADFLTTTDPDFYPTDILQDADGSLLMCDTGAWYVDACPISRVAKPEIKGSIYRIRKTGSPPMGDGWGRKIKWETAGPEELTRLLSDARFRVRERASHELVARGNAAGPALETAVASSRDAETRRAAVWALFQISEESPVDSIRAALRDSSVEVRIAAIQALGQLHDSGAVPGILERLSSENAAERREAATALGMIRDPATVPALLRASANAADRFEEHALIYALIEIGDRKTLLSALGKAEAGPAGEAALIALDQLREPLLIVDHAIPFLESASARARQAGLWVASHHPDWSGPVLQIVDSNLRRHAGEPATTAMAKEILTAYAGTADGQSFIASRVTNAQNSATLRVLLLDIIDGAAAANPLGSWLDALTTCLGDVDESVRWRALEIVRGRRIDAMADALASIADDPAEKEKFRLAALSAMFSPGDLLAGDRLRLVLDNLAPESEPGTRQTAAALLARAKLTADAKLSVAKQQLPVADALVMTAVLESFSGETDAPLGVALIDGLEENPHASDLLTAAQLDRVLQGFPPEVQSRAGKLKSKLDQRDAGLMTRFVRFEPLLGAGDVGRGRALFFGDKAACSTCHAIGNEGGTLGPDLTTIGLVRSGHDILESIMFPSASMVADYQPFNVEARGELLNGIVARETPESITLRTAATETRTISRGEIRSMTPAAMSMMPEGLDSALTDEQLLDLLAFLQSLNNEQWLLPEQRERDARKN
jgi:putative membrane-bound dehydrogenase-like protein